MRARGGVRDAVRRQDAVRTSDAVPARDAVRARDAVPARDAVRTKDVVQARGRTCGIGAWRGLGALMLLSVVGTCGGGDGAGEAAGDGAGDVPDVSAETPATTPPAMTAHNTLSAEEAAAGWVLLFDGQSTDSWRGYGRDDFPTGGWSVENGELVGLSSGGGMDGGDIITTAAFTDFELVFDFKVGPEGNSGVFYRVQEVDGKELWQVAPEYQVLDDPAYIAMGTMDMNTHLTGDNYDLQAAGEKTMYPTGEWNSARIVVDGTHVEHWLNGRMTVEYELYSDEWEALVAASKFADEEAYARAPSGSIGLQDHGTPSWFRNIKIRPLGGR